MLSGLRPCPAFPLAWLAAVPPPQPVHPHVHPCPTTFLVQQ